ncbi:MAG: protein-disulfide reductase DsbD domain-containing protein [Candidatus Acidiferrales bacterium]|jgi:thiol:disulfide interchange protein DsbD
MTPAPTHPADNEHLKVELVSDTNSVSPGRPLWVGLHFEPEKQWHIYWINPGDSGEPPRVTWYLPDGFQAGPIRWPAPMRLGSGTVIDYGYEEPVLLPVELRAPPNLEPGTTVTLAATVGWLVCRDICVPGKGDVTLSLPVQGPASTAVSSSHELFQAARSRLPKPEPSAWKVDAIAEKDQFVLTVRARTATAKASFFPLDEDQIDNSAPQTVSAFPGGVRLTLKKSDQLLKTPAALRGVLELGPGRAYEVSAPVLQAP